MGTNVRAGMHQECTKSTRPAACMPRLSHMLGVALTATPPLGARAVWPSAASRYARNSFPIEAATGPIVTGGARASTIGIGPALLLPSQSGSLFSRLGGGLPQANPQALGNYPEPS